MSKRGLGTQLRHLLARLDGDVQRVYEDLDVSFRPRFYPVAQQLLRDGPANVNFLARQTGVSQPAATQTLAEMRKLGLIALSRGRDRRERMVDLTPEGRQVADRLDLVWKAVDAAATELDDELPAPLSATVGRALAALERKPFYERIKEKMSNA